MRAGYMSWSHTEELELGRCRIYADMFSGNLMCSVAGLYYNSGKGWRLEAEQEARRDGERVIWIDGTGAEHVFRNGRDADGAGFTCVQAEDGIKIRDAGGNLLRFSADGRVWEAKLAGGGGLEYVYTGGRLTAVAGCGMRRVFAYEAGRPVTLAGDGVAFYDYSGEMLAAVRFGDGAPGVEFGYKGGFLSSAICGDEHVDVEYDKIGRVRRINGAEYAYFEGYTVVNDGGEWRYWFDAAGRCTGAGNGERTWEIDGYSAGSIRDVLGI